MKSWWLVESSHCVHERVGSGISLVSRLCRNVVQAEKSSSRFEDFEVRAQWQRIIGLSGLI